LRLHPNRAGPLAIRCQRAPSPTTPAWATRTSSTRARACQTSPGAAGADAACLPSEHGCHGVKSDRTAKLVRSCRICPLLVAAVRGGRRATRR
jgi:hypothetical protein